MAHEVRGNHFVKDVYRTISKKTELAIVIPQGAAGLTALRSCPNREPLTIF
jgi:hypothetical protein